MGVPTNVLQIQGQTVVTADILNSYVQTVSSVTALRSFIGVVGMEVRLQGLSTPDDGGQGNFLWFATVTQTDDGVNYIIPPGANSGGWVRQGIFASIFANLPTPSSLNKGARTFITDGAASPVFGAIAVGGGSLYTTVYSDGSSWRNG